MKPTRISKGWVLAAFTALGLATASSAHAFLSWSVTVDGSQACAVDQDAFVCSHGTQILDANPAPNSLGITDVVGGVLFDTSLHSAVNGPPFAILSSSNALIINQNSATATVTMAVSATDYSPVASNATTSLTGVWLNATSESQITVEWWNDPGNNQGADTPGDRPGVLVDTFTNMATSPVELFVHAGGPFVVSDPAPFSMTLGFDFILAADGGAIANLDASETKEVVANVVPEPPALALIAIALVVLGIQRRRRHA